MSTILATVSPTLRSSCKGESEKKNCLVAVFVLQHLLHLYSLLLSDYANYNSPPVIGFFFFFRLLGPSAAADILQLSSSLPLQSRGRARLLVGNEDVHIIARSDDELLDDFFHEQSSTGGQAGENYYGLL